MGWRSWMPAVLDNLIGNARDACKDAVAPEVVVQTRFVSGIARVMRLGRPVKLPIEVQVSDNGPGIPQDRREDIFLPFYTTHKGGSGVGLSFARQVALAHGGSICAIDAPEGGASIRMVI